MRIDEINERLNQISEELRDNAGSCDIDALTEEFNSLENETKEIREAAEKEAELRGRVDNAVIDEIKENKDKEGRKMPEIEIRNTPAYLEAYANFLKTGKDTECRKLLSENAGSGGSVPVPELVAEGIKHAWENNEIMNLVNKTYVRGNLKVGFEKTAGTASIHTEGTDAPSEETLVLGIRELVPQSLKKWITVSDEALDLAGESFLRYIVDEVSAKIAQLAADTIVNDIATSPTTSSATAPAAAKITAATIAATTIAEALGKISDEANQPVIIMNKGSLAAFKAVQYALGYGADIFEGMRVIFSSKLKAFSAATTGDVYAIVGDLRHGAQANFPNGEEISVKIDDLSLAEQDLVKIVGREYVGLGVVAPFAFCNIAK